MGFQDVQGKHLESQRLASCENHSRPERFVRAEQKGGSSFWKAVSGGIGGKKKKEIGERP